MQKVANCVGRPAQSAVERAVTGAKHRRHAGTMQRPADTAVHTVRYHGVATLHNTALTHSAQEKPEM